jgi:hypothetical protein
MHSVACELTTVSDYCPTPPHCSYPRMLGPVTDSKSATYRHASLQRRQPYSQPNASNSVTVELSVPKSTFQLHRPFQHAVGEAKQMLLLSTKFHVEVTKQKPNSMPCAAFKVVRLKQPCPDDIKKLLTLLMQGSGKRDTWKLRLCISAN